LLLNDFVRVLTPDLVKGLPFFGYTIPGAQGDDKRPAWAKRAYQLHKQAGLGLEFLIPAHVGAVGFHMFKGQHILARMGIGSKVLK
jgi:cytochrome b561